LPLSDPRVFGTARGRRQSESNIRERILAPAIERADAILAERDQARLPGGITSNSLRRTFASVLYALGADPPTVMAEMGHTDPGLALRLYAQAMRRDEGTRHQLRALVEGSDFGLMWTQSEGAASQTASGEVS
jgi:integrase